MRPARAITVLTLLVLLAVAAAGPAAASTRLMKLTEDRYLLTHQKQTFYGGQGRALRQTYEKAGSLCVVLGYSWFEIRDSQSKGRTWGSGAATTLEVKLYKEKSADQEDLLDCAALASEEEKERMRRKLRELEP